MHAGEPDLLDGLTVGGSSGPQVRLKRPPALVNGQRTHGIGAPAEPEQEDLVAFAPVVRDEAIGLLDVLRQPAAQAAADVLVGRALRAHAGVVIDHLRDLLEINRRQAPHDLQYVGRLRLVSRIVVNFLVRLVPGPIAADNQPLATSLHLPHPSASSQNSAQEYGSTRHFASLLLAA